MCDISIIMPSFNQAKFIKAAIDSVLDQRGDFEHELIVIDGGSTDGTVEILRSYGDRLKFVSEPDQGQSDAINKGFRLAGGRYHGWLNSDDLYLPGSFQTIIATFRDHPETQWLYGKVQIVNEAGVEIRKHITAYKNWRMKSFSLPRLLSENWISQMGVFWSAQAGREVGPLREDLHYAMDYDYWLRLGARWPGRYVDANLACFRWYQASKSGHNFSKQMREDLAIAVAHANGNHRWPILQHRLNRWKIVAAYSLIRLWPTSN
ncbi:glycosyltransferase [bacterium]|uniref:Glycosyl transferase family 2 n=1 Tax=Rubinisphaera brasiliensis (strain ATCC 49424 / DSM 5305 / JCM 21570 / IAM 15109 / NBRC 103401 / IFAM 1448) TaxID=756272 RepID=F0SNN5_RUBBR|nr:glycosyltransferase family 2 protein [Rubinisphaera brasiliensis]ADY58921.1 glycosyl transferase family 2 [Rubinisphaera brasiliensis DSM 5305]MBR9800243.1 glycosyltransferase [bacterium]